MSGPTHIRGHTLVLIFKLGLNIDSICSEKLHVTDHECVMFNLSCNLDSLPSKCVKCSHILNYLSAEKFSVVFDPGPVLSSHDDGPCLVQVNDNICYFQYKCWRM